MSPFVHKKISPGHSLGETLLRARENRGLSQEQVSQDTKIAVKYLQALETGDFIYLPGDVYVKAWLRLLATIYDKSADDLFATYSQEKNGQSGFHQEQGRRRKLRFSFFRPENLKKTSVIVIVFILFIYLAYELVNILRAPNIKIVEPADNWRTSSSTVNIIGQTQSEAQMMINNQPVLLDEKGQFNQSVDLAPGLNNLKISVKKKNSQTRYLEYKIYRDL